MSYDQKYQGSYQFADAHCLEAGLDAFVTVDDSVLDVGDLAIEELTVKVSWNGSAPASMSEHTHAALRQLAEHARTGAVKTSFFLDGESRETIRAAGRRSAAGLPPAHHRWEVFAAGRAGDAKALRALRARGVDLAVDFPHHRGYSTLHLASEAASAEAIAVLLEAGLAVDRRRDPAAVTALAIARSAAAVKALLAAGADPNVTIGDRRPLEIACDHGRDEVALALLDGGATVRAGAPLEEMLKDGARTGSLKLVMALVERQPAAREVLAREAVVEAAIRNGDPVLVDYLLDHGAELPSTFLHDAAEAGAIELLRTGLQSPGAVERCGRSSRVADPMCAAARDGHLEAVKLMAARGVPLSPAEPGETSPLHLAVSGSGAALPCARWLLEEGAPVSAPSADGETPLARACSIGTRDAIALLLEYGADPAEVTDQYDRDRLQVILEATTRKSTKKKAAPVAAKQKKKKTPAAGRKKRR